MRCPWSERPGPGGTACAVRGRAGALPVGTSRGVSPRREDASGGRSGALGAGLTGKVAQRWKEAPERGNTWEGEAVREAVVARERAPQAVESEPVRSRGGTGPGPVPCTSLLRTSGANHRHHEAERGGPVEGARAAGLGDTAERGTPQECAGDGRTDRGTDGHGSWELGAGRGGGRRGTLTCLGAWVPERKPAAGQSCGHRPET